MEAIHFIITGGTWDAIDDDIAYTKTPVIQSAVPSFITQLKLYDKTKFSQLYMKDSRSLTLNDRNKIVATIEKSTSKKIIITHGTYTMADTAMFIKGHLSRKDQTIILTGSMVPLISGGVSDAGFALGFALSSVHILKPGVYVCMNGKVFLPEEVVKIISSGRFISLSGKKRLLR